MRMNARHPRASAVGWRAAAVSAAAATLAALGCDNKNDQDLWGNSMTPTDIQNADAGPGPMTMPDPSDGDNEDPFTDNPGYPYTEEPWQDSREDA